MPDEILLPVSAVNAAMKALAPYSVTLVVREKGADRQFAMSISVDGQIAKVAYIRPLKDEAEYRDAKRMAHVLAVLVRKLRFWVDECMRNRSPRHD